MTLISFSFISVVILTTQFISEIEGVCDGNPHKWGRLRRCDQYDPSCPELFQNCTTCEGIGGIASSDKLEDFQATQCKSIGTAKEMKKRGVVPKPPSFPEQFVNKKFYEVQIFVRRDPFCFAQVPSSVSNGTHCYKRQEGTFNYDVNQRALRIDYFQSETVFGANMTEIFHHIDDCVHPQINHIGIDHVPVCPCINVSIGIVTPNWAFDAEYVGRESLKIEFLEERYGDKSITVDHFVKGPHHVWADLETGNIVRLWQPYNGLEVFDPHSYVNKVEDDLRKLGPVCQAGSKVCIQTR